jgi:hypothetical protein
LFYVFYGIIEDCHTISSSWLVARGGTSGDAGWAARAFRSGAANRMLIWPNKNRKYTIKRPYMTKTGPKSKVKKKQDNPFFLLTAICKNAKLREG